MIAICGLFCSPEGVKDKKRKFLREKLSENVGKPKELWKIIKTKRVPRKVSHNKHMPQYEKFSARTIAKTCKELFANLQESWSRNS